MENELAMIAPRMLLAVLAGGLIGIERSFHGRAAGFRTHTLVCAASALLVLVTGMYGGENSDPLRTIQGIVTGIGFLGAGVILKEGASVRGLTTAASIWMTAAIGITIGNGAYLLAFFTATLTLVTLIVFRWIEAVFPSHQLGTLVVRLPGSSGFRGEELTSIIREHGARVTGAGYHSEDNGNILVCTMAVHTRRQEDFQKLAEAFRKMKGILDFDLKKTSR